jgi:ATP-dependent protease ClpP protease subunit
MWALHQDNDKWYQIRNQKDGPTQLFIYDEIGYFGVGAQDLVRDLADIEGPIQVHINSPGGEVWEGITIYNTLLARDDVTVVIDGIAASIASVIACAGNPTLISKQGQLVIHDGFTMAIGNASELRDLATKLDRASNTIAGVYAERTGQTAEHWRELMKVETTFNAQEAIEAGLVNGYVQNGRAQVPEHSEWDLSGLFQNAQLVNAASRPFVGREQTRHAPMSGRHEHDHSAGGAGDHDDGIHMHPHTHNGEADHHGHEHSASDSGASSDTDWNEEQARMLCQVLDLEYDQVLNWDASAAYAKCHSNGDFSSIAFRKAEGEPDAASGYGLPHHATPHGPPDKGGVIAALGRWNQTRGLKNKQAALSHLKEHARALGLPSGDDRDPGKLWDLGDSEEDVQRFMKALKGA